ncbi:MAG: NAD-dependent epimerase/dehydratase family protein [Athalassotoga sp.]|uniref:NAD-dependent epimerase/dehydratase family protein n=1 Tax=Athalassotoga sp. TaxID=2022597 RepID=UPI003CFC79A6
MIVVTGATGHIGNVLVKEIVKRGEKVRAFVMPSESLTPLAGLDVEYFYGDVRDIKSLQEGFRDAKIVYHLAGIVSISKKSKNIFDVNVGGTQNVIKACLDCKVERLVYMSSIHAFVEPPKGVPIKETKSFDPSKVVGEYAKSKAMATIAVLESIDRGLDAVIVHPTGVIGPYEYKLSNIGQMIYNFMKGKIHFYINGTYDFVDVRDVVDGTILACEKGRRGENYILSGEQITVKSIFEILSKAFDVKCPSVEIPTWIARLAAPIFELSHDLFKKSDQQTYTAYSIHTLLSNSLTSHEKASKELGYSPRSIEISIKDTAKWISENFYPKHSAIHRTQKMRYWPN